MKSHVVKQTTKVKKALFEYETNKVVQINSKKIGILLRFFQCLILAYIIGYVLIYMHGYQENYRLTSSVVSKVKGVGSSLNSGIRRKMWDVTDMVVPSQESHGIFITTNVIETRNQSQTTCAEDHTIFGVKCQTDSECNKDEAILLGNGVMTGKCILSKQNIKTCEIRAWCPLENDTINVENMSLLKEVPKFTVLIKNEIIFENLNVQRSNLFAWENGDVPKNCLFNPKHPLLKYCPIFQISSFIGNLTGRDMTELLTYGGIIQVIITWNCNLDYSERECKPKYSFNRLDSKTAKISRGWNFRYANYYADDGKEYRTLYKVFGLRILIEVRGLAQKFSPIQFTMNLGSGLALLALATVICDFIILFILPNRDKYFQSKYELLEDDDAYTVSQEQETELVSQSTNK